MNGCLEISSRKLHLTGTLTAKASQPAYYMQYPSLNLSSPTLQPDEILKPLSIKLQKRDIDVYEAYNHNEDLKGEQQDIRGNIERYCLDWYSMATSTARKANIKPSVPRVVGRQKHRSNVEAGAPKDYYKTALTISLQDHLISEMDTYFDSNNAALVSSLPCLLPALLVSREGNPVLAALQYYVDDLPSLQVFDMELFRWRRKWLMMQIKTQLCSSGNRRMQP